MASNNTPVGFTSTIDCFGDSLTAGAGGNGQTIVACLSALYPTRIVNNWGIGGQKSAQIAARQGGAPITLAVTGGSLPAAFATAAVTPSVQLLSTPQDNTVRYLSGLVNNAPATLIRNATGGPPSTTESYTIMGAGNTAAVAVPTWAPFHTDQGWNARDSIQALWLGRNDVADLSVVGPLVAACVAYIHDPKRYIVIGVLPGVSEANTATFTRIAAANAALAATYGSLYVPVTPPTVAEMAAVGYTPTPQDNTDIANGVFPTGMHADDVHLNGTGYLIFALRVKIVIDAQGW